MTNPDLVLPTKILKDAARRLKKVMTNKKVPILQYVRFDAEDTVTARATDLEQHLVLTLPGSGKGTGLVPLKVLEQLGKADSDEVGISFAETGVSFAETLFADDKLTVPFEAMDPRDFPSCIEVGETIFHADSKPLCRDIKAVYAAAVTSKRAKEQSVSDALHGLYLEYDDKGSFRLTCTDGERLHSVGPDVRQEGVLLPSWIQVLPRLMPKGPVRILRGKKTVSFETDDLRYTVQLMGLQYPAYRNVLPRNEAVHAKLPVSVCLRALKMLKEFERVHVKLDGFTETATFSSDKGASVAVPLEVVRGGAELPYRFSVSFYKLNDALKLFLESVTVKIGFQALCDDVAGRGPLELQEEDRLAVMMTGAEEDKACQETE